MSAAGGHDRSKVPDVTLVFWVIKIAATTLGETGGDTLTMTTHLGYLLGSAIVLAVFMVVVCAQIVARRFNRWLYWLVVVATTTLGTTMADFADRSLGIGYAGGSSILLCLLFVSLAAWHRVVGSVSVSRITTPRTEMFYWVTILFSQTLGTALGDWTADTMGFGYEGGALLFAAALAIVAAGYFASSISRTLLFWMAFILTRPLGATVGDLLDKPVSHGGLALGRPAASAVLTAFIVICLLVFRQKATTDGPVQNAAGDAMPPAAQSDHAQDGS